MIDDQSIGRKFHVLRSWVASALLTPAILGVLGFFWQLYTDLVNIRASETARDHRIEKLEQSYSDDIKRMDAKLDKIYEHLLNK